MSSPVCIHDSGQCRYVYRTSNIKPASGQGEVKQKNVCGHMEKFPVDYVLSTLYHTFISCVCVQVGYEMDALDE